MATSNPSWDTWIPTTEPPPEGIKVETKIDDQNGVRNVQVLKRSGRLWFDDGVYVYYTPTHWRYPRSYR